jgi:membrane protein YdbS with pleckstrin-like domain
MKTMALGAFTSFVRNPVNTDYQGEDTDETIEILLRKSLYTLIPKILMSSFLLIFPLFLIPFLARTTVYRIPVFDGTSIFSLTFFFYLFAFGFTLEAFLDWFFEVFLVTNKKVVDINEGCKSISETPLVNVQDINSKIRGSIGEIFNVGDIFLQTAGERTEFKIELVDNPSVVRDVISDLVTKEKENGHIQ